MNLFSKQIAQVPVDTIAKVIGVPLRTAYSWHDGTRVPAAWVQVIVLEKLGARRGRPKKTACTTVPPAAK